MSSGNKIRSIARRALGSAAILSAGLAPFAVYAEETPTAAALRAAPEVAGVDVQGRRGNPLSSQTGLAVLPDSVQDTPQAINVVSSEVLEQQHIVTLEQALKTVPGITVAIGEGGTLSGDQFKIRGQDAANDIYIDGLRDFGSYTRDSFNYQEVQVLKGPSGAMFGRGTTGGVVNTITKTPMMSDLYAVSGAVGNGEYYRFTADLNKALSATSGVRLNLMGQSNHVVDRDLIRSKRWGAALSAGFGLGTDTTVLVNYLHQHDNRLPDYGLVIIQRPGEVIAQPAPSYDVGVKRSNFTGYDQDRDRTTADVLTVRVSHKASPWLSFSSDTRVGVYSRYFQYSNTDSCSAACNIALFDNNPATIPYGAMGGGGPYDADAWGAQNISTVRLDAPIGGFRNRLIAGVDLSYQSNDKTFSFYTLPTGITDRRSIARDLINPDHTMPAGYRVFAPTPSNIAGTTATLTSAVTTDAESTDYGAFFTDRFWLSKSWSIIGSLRLDKYRVSYTSVTVAGASSTIKSKSDLTNPRVSLVYEPSDSQTYYASWGRSANPQGTGAVASATALTANTKDLEPEVNQTWEAGAKFSVMQGRLGLSASVFQVKKNNALQTDPSTGFVQLQSGERQRIRGVELGATGRITPAWTINAAYAYIDADIRESFSNCTVPAAGASGTPTNVVCPVGVTVQSPVPNTIATGNQVTFTPKNSASLWTTYDFKDVVKGLSVGGGVTYQSRVYLGYTGVSSSYADRSTLVATKLAQAPSNLSLDALVEYRVRNVRLALNANNLTDRLNYAQVFGNRGVPAPGRSFVFSVSAAF